MVKKLYEYHFKKTGRRGLILQIDDGFGEIAPLPGFSRETFSEAKKEAFDVLFEKKEPSLPSVKFGFMTAKKPFLNAPIKAPLCALNRPHSGCTTLKLKVGELSLEQASNLISKYLGKYKLRVDFNKKWPLENILRFASVFKKEDFEYLEDPGQSLEDLVIFSKKTDYPIALDHFREEDTKDIASLKALVIKPTLWGYIPKMKKIPITFSSSYESSLGILLIAQMSSSNTPLGLDTFSEDLLNPPLKVEDGFLCWSPSTNPIAFEKLCLLATVP